MKFFVAASISFCLTLISCTPKSSLDLEGRRIFEEGISTSNTPLTAKIAGEKLSSSDILACAHCHFRSGLGSREGVVIAPQIPGKSLFRADFQGSELLRRNLDKLHKNIKPLERRPAYTKESLAYAIRMGIDSAGNKLNAAMPRFDLSEDDMKHLISYIENLGKEDSPGVTDTTISFATIVTDDVSATDRDSLILALQAYARAWNRDPRNQIMRAQNGFLHGASMYQGYRKIDLSIWELKGDPKSYRSQLDAYYSAKPVFALLSGIGRNWKPIHEFSEQKRIPCLLPITDFPVVSEKDWYTLYFSKGLFQEGETVARYISRLETATTGPILQIFKKEPVGVALAEGLRANQEILNAKIIDVEIKDDKQLTPKFVAQLMETHQPQAVMFWLDSNQFQLIANLTESKKRPDTVFISSTQAGDKISVLPQQSLSQILMTHPYALTQTNTRPFLIARAWLRANKLAVKNLNIQVKAYFVVSMLTAALASMHSNFQRDYFLESMDMMIDQNYTVPVYPNLSFGPGQRYASKGCYIVQIERRNGIEQLVPKSDWLTF